MEECSYGAGPAPAPAPPPNQMGMSLGPFSYPFAQERHTANATGQEPMVFNTSVLDSYNLGKSELNSSFLDLLSGRSHHPPNETRLPYSALAQAAQLQVRHGGSSVEASNFHSSAFGKPISFQPSQGSIGVAGKSSRTFTRPSASSPSNAKQQHMLNHSRSSQGCSAGIGMSSKTLQLSSSSSPSIANHQHRLNQSRPSIQGSSAGTEISSRTLRWPSVSGPSIQGSSSGTETSSRTLMRPSASSPSNANRPHVLNQGIEKMTPEVRPPLSNHSGAIFRGRPRVFCMNKAGELFVSDMGHFGVICFCHGQPMSVKMFSEHSGSPSANPGETVHLENGMTIAQWRTLFSGVMTSDCGNGWDWSNSPSPIGGLLGSKPNNLPISSQNSASINSLGTFGGLGNAGEQRNTFVFPDHTHTELGELTVLEKSVRRGGDHGHQSGLHGHTPFTKNFSVSAQSTLPALAKNHMVQDIQKSPTLVGFDGPCLTLNQGQHDAWPQLVANNITSMREKGNLPISFSSSGMKNSFNYGNNISRGDFPSKTLLVDQDGPSNIELRLGHLSQKNNTFTSSSPAAMRTLHIGAVNLQKSELCESLTCRTEHPRETKKSWFNRHRTPSETSSLHRQSHHSFGSNMLNHSESELTQKNHSDLEVPTDDATKNSLISFLSHLGTGGNCSSNSTDNICNRGSGGCVHSSSLDDRQATLYFNKLSGMMQTVPNCTNNNQFPEVAFLGNMDHHGNATHEPASSFHKPTSRHASLSSEIKNLRDGTLKSTSLRHLERSLSSHDNPLSHRRFCCLSDVEQQRNVVNRDDLVAAKERNEELYHITQQAAEDMAISAHSQQRNVVSRDDFVAAKERNKGLYRVTQHDAEDTAVKSAHSLSSCYSGGGVQILAVKPDSSGLYNWFDCSASTQRLELCPKEHGFHLSSGHICHAEQPFQRLGTISNHCYSGRSESETCDHKGESSSFSGKCCHTASQKYLTGCCYPLVDSLAGGLNGHFCRNAKPVHINPPCDEVLKDRERIRLGHCECLQEHRVVKNDCRVALWRDVPKKAVQHSDATSNENSLQILQAEKGIGKQQTDTAGKVLNGAHQESKSTKEQQMSIICSGTSAPTVTELTEVSIEANNVVSFSTDAETSKFVHDLAVDEGSRIEKCGSSSDEAHDNRECGEASAFKGEVKNINSSCNHTGELRLNSSNFKRKHQIITGCTAQSNVSQIPDIQSACKARKGKGSMQWSNIEASVPGLDLSSVYSESPKHVGHSFCQSSVKVVDHPCEPEVVIQKTVGSRKDSSFKRKRSAFFSTKPFSKKGLESYHEPLEFSGVQSIEDDHTLKKQKVSTAKKAKQELALNGKKQYMKDGHQLDAGKPPKFMSLSCLGNSSNHGIGTPCKKARPVVCGNSGIISSGLSDKQKPAKLVSLDSILKKTSRCSLTEYEGKLCMSRNKKTRLNAKTRGPNTFTKLQGENEDYRDATSNIIDPSNNATCESKKYSSKDDGSPFGNCIIRQDGDCGSNKAFKSGLHHEDAISGSMLSCEEIHKCSLNKLTGSNKHAPNSCSVKRDENYFSGIFEARNQSKTCPSTEIGSERHTAKKCSKKCLISRSSGDARSVTSHDDKDSADELRELNNRRPNKEWRCQSIVSDSKASCCVCGDSEKEDVNQLLECNNCLIRVHQACYGIAKAPKGRWCCRPCKTNSLNTVCVLCGYGNGAMTRALKSQNAVNSLLRTWKLGTASSHLNSVILSEWINAQILELDSVGKASEFGSSVRVTESVDSEVFPGVTLEKDLARVNTVQHLESVSKDFQAYNSIIAGTLDPSVAQWVHMVCGLWTPGTRCPNVDTMSTFDVSGASPARKNCVCSLCNRPGGSCIACRVPNCSVLFHPWCAHQKGLLQSETEGDGNKKVGFYGRCMDHATYIGLQDHSHHADNRIRGLEDEISTCARTEGFKGRKKDEGFDPNHQKPSKDGGPCIVSEEQKNAWFHINRKKPCTRRVVKVPSSDLEYDVRKEYIRYKQSKGWKYLVVYKSGIHALGLYTSQFIGRGAMVVEYVGEIVGLRVADKREIEYQSGRRLQYKSACYFFRIDKEHIIDATRKGGIARFVNHSCRPNCAAKVISVRNEKKVVFFAERDIYQGEEITYDYHFNREDEGQKIPCLCNSNNCRHYLN